MSFVAKTLVFSKLKQKMKFKMFMMTKNPHNFLNHQLRNCLLFTLFPVFFSTRNVLGFFLCKKSVDFYFGNVQVTFFSWLVSHAYH